MPTALLLALACLLVVSVPGTNGNPPALEAAVRPAPYLFECVASPTDVAASRVEPVASIPTLPLRI